MEPEDEREEKFARPHRIVALLSEVSPAGPSLTPEPS